MITYKKVYLDCEKANGKIVLYYKGAFIMHPSRCINLLMIGFKIVNGNIYQWVYDGCVPEFYKSSIYDREDLFENPLEGWLYALRD